MRYRKKPVVIEAMQFLGTFYLKWLTDKPEFVICSYRAYAALGPTLFGWLDMYPEASCEEQWLYGMREL